MPGKSARDAAFGYRISVVLFFGVVFATMINAVAAIPAEFAQRGTPRSAADRMTGILSVTRMMAIRAFVDVVRAHGRRSTTGISVRLK
ncbi:MAG: hypothetical protein B7Y47_02200 [Sphingomonas sp. 28-63-12]|nr:MAG: hypothetical protein B7Y47_02200 [Sphingomonas sp. 28-63-12]